MWNKNGMGQRQCAVALFKGWLLHARMPAVRKPRAKPLAKLPDGGESTKTPPSDEQYKHKYC